MTFRVDHVTLLIDGWNETNHDRHTIDVPLPPDHPLVAQILAWNDARLLANARAEGVAGQVPL